MSKLTDAEWIALMRPLCQAARLWVEATKLKHPSRFKAELELVRAVESAIARADARPIEEQLEEAEEMARCWTERARRLRSSRP